MGGASSASGGETGGVVAGAGTTAGGGGRAVGGTSSSGTGATSAGGGRTAAGGGTVSGGGGTISDGGDTTSGGGDTTSGGGESGEAGDAGLGGESTTGGGEGGSSDAGGSSGAGGQGSTGNGDLVAQGVRWVGRVSAGESTRFAWSGTGFIARFSGTGISATLTNAEGYLFQTIIDGAKDDSFLATRGEVTYPLAAGLTPGEHVVELYRQTEGRYGVSELKQLEVVDGELLEPPLGPGAVLEVIGDSISCGYGNLGADASCSFSFSTESHWDSYGAVAGRALGIDVHTIAFSGHGLTRNNDGTTVELLPDLYERTLTREPSLLWQYSVVPKVIVVNLGTNDFAQGNPGTDFEDQYRNFLTRLRDLHPDAFLLATLGPMMNGTNLANARAYILGAVAAFEADGKVGFLEYSGQVAGELGCNSHPNVVKHQQMADALVARISELNLY